MKKKTAILSVLLAAAMMGMTACGDNTDSSSSKSSSSKSESSSSQAEDSSSAEESSSESSDTDVIKISSKEDFMKIYDDLTASYSLEADIDFGGDVIEPIGTFKPKSENPEDEENPNTDIAFTGSFDGNGYTISNVTVDAVDKNGVGLFGCITGEGSGVKNLKVDSVKVKGGNYTGGVIGLADFGSHIEDVQLTGENTVEGKFLVGGIAGASHADIINCSAAASVTLTEDNAQGAGIIVGGQEDASLENCTASGKIKTGDGCFSVGGVAGCFHNSEYAKNCTAENVEITTGDKCWLLGGLAGHSGTFENSPTLVENGIVKNVSIKTGENSERIGGIIVGGFYGSAYKEYYPEPSKSDVKACSVSDLSITGGKYVGAAVGYSYGTTTVSDFSGKVIWNDKESEEQIGADNKVALDKLI